MTGWTLVSMVFIIPLVVVTVWEMWDWYRGDDGQVYWCACGERLLWPDCDCTDADGTEHDKVLCQPEREVL